MLTFQDREKLLSIISTLPIDYRNPIDIACCYTISTLIIDAVQPQSIDCCTVAPYLRSDDFTRYLHIYSLDTCINAATAVSYANTFSEFCSLLILLGLNEDYITFFNAISPNIVSSWTILEKLFPAIPQMLTALFMILCDAKELLGTPDVIALNPFDSYWARESTYNTLGIDADNYFNLWCSIHFTQLYQPIKTVSAPIRRSMKAYRDHNVPYQKLLNDYALAQKHRDDLKVAINPWQHLPDNLTPNIERGMTTDEALFNAAAWPIRYVNATELVQALFYKGRDDADIECSFILHELLTEVRDSKKILVVNPSPSFLVEYNNQALPDHIQTMFSVVDDTLRDIYALQFPSYKFCSIPNLSSLSPDYDFLLILARDYNLSELAPAYSLCAQNARIMAFLPQKCIATKQKDIAVFPIDDVHIDKIIEIPGDVTNSRNRRKMLIYANYGDIYAVEQFQLLFGACDQNRTHFVVQTPTYNIPVSWLNERMWLKQLQRKYTDQLHAGVVRHPESYKEYAFSKEITICYNPLPNRKNRYSAEAYYRALLRPHEQNRKRGDKLVPATEKGLRSSDEADLMHRLEFVALRDEFASIITQDIIDYYRERPEALSLKTIWYCCREPLCRTLSYREDIAVELFCGNNQTLSQLIPFSSDIDAFVSSMELLFSDKETNKNKYWIQLNLILNIAKREGFIAENPLASHTSVIAQLARSEMKEVRRNLVKNSFTYDQEAKMLAFLLEPIGDNHISRCICESKWLIGAIRLFTGMPVREACALQWMHFREIEHFGTYQLHILQHMNNENKIVSLIGYHNQRKLRKIPLAPLLAHILLARLEHLLSHYDYSIEEVMEQPIILSKEPTNRHPNTLDFCTRNAAKEVSKIILQKAEIPEKKITLLEGDMQFEEDLNAVTSDLFYNNFQHRAFHTCNITEGMIAYISGIQAPITFDKSYGDYKNSFVQHGLVIALNNWTYRHTCPFTDTQSTTHRTVNILGRDYYEVVAPSPLGCAAANLIITPTSTQTLEDILVEISCNHGVTGNAIAFAEEVISND